MIVVISVYALVAIALLVVFNDGNGVDPVGLLIAIAWPGVVIGGLVAIVLGAVAKALPWVVYQFRGKD